MENQNMSMNNNDKKPNISFGVEEEINEEQRIMLTKLVEMMGVKEMSLRQDRQEEAISKIQETLNQLIESNNTLVKNSQSGQQIGSPNQQMDKLEAFGKIVEGLQPVIDRLWPANNATQSIVPNEYITEKVKESIMSNFEIGEAIQQNLKSKLIGKAITKSLNSTLHEPI